MIESLRRMCETCHSTDFTLTPSSTAISRLRLPSTTSCATRRSAALSSASRPASSPSGASPSRSSSQRIRPSSGARSSWRAYFSAERSRSMARADSLGLEQQQPAREVGADLCLEPGGAGADEDAERLVEELHAPVGRSDRGERAQRVGDGVRRVQGARVGELLLDEPGRGGDLAAGREDPGQPAAPGQPGVVLRRGELLAGALVVRHRLVGLPAGRGELAEAEAGLRRHRAADPHQRGQLA